MKEGSADNPQEAIERSNSGAADDVDLLFHSRAHQTTWHRLSFTIASTSKGHCWAVWTSAILGIKAQLSQPRWHEVIRDDKAIEKEKSRPPVSLIFAQDGVEDRNGIQTISTAASIDLCHMLFLRFRSLTILRWSGNRSSDRLSVL